MNKNCKTCGITKDINEFPLNKSCVDKHRLVCKSCYKEVNREYHINYRIKNAEYKKKTNALYNITNKEKLKERRKKVDRKEYHKLYIQNRRKIDPLYRLSKNIRSLIKGSFKKTGYKNNSKTATILGCSFAEFKTYMESKFESWMLFENQGVYTGNYNETWQIDHIIPLSSVNTEEELIRLNHYTNLQPLCSRKNLEKSNTE